MRTGKDRVQVEAVNVPREHRRRAVNPGDLMRGDADGVLVIPSTRDAVLAAAEESTRSEQQIRQALREGKTLAEARKALGYHQLQSRRS